MPLDKPSRNTTGVPVFESKSCLYRYTYIYIYKTIIYDQRDCKEVLQLALSDSLMHKCELWVLNFKEKRDVKNQSQIENSSFSLLSFFPTKKIPRYCFHPQSCISSPPPPPQELKKISYMRKYDGNMQRPSRERIVVFSCGH